MNKICIQQIKCLYTLFFVVCAASSFGTQAHAQTSRVTIDLKNVTMERVMDEIESQTSFLFLSNKDVDIKKRVSVDVRSRPLGEALAQMVRGTDVSYKIDGQYILLTRTNTSPVTISGTVVDNTGIPVIGASVVIKGTAIGVSTDTAGNFTLTVPAPAESAILVVNYLGFETVETAVGTRTSFHIVLHDSSIQMENIVVTALGIRRQERALSYNVQQIRSEEITTVRDANFMNSLVGKVAGVQINSGSSGPGSSVRVVMRGEKSIEKGNNVLYVIDGIPMYNHSFGGTGGTYAAQTGSESISDINPEDIESINMLTGPSAAALYGSDAANGVVIVNTKRGLKDRTVVNVSNSTTFSTIRMLPDMQTSYGTSSGLMNWGDPYSSGFDAKKFFNTGTNVFNSVSVSTGSQRNQTYISASTTNSMGIIPDNTYDRYNFTARNTTYFAHDKLVFDFGASYIIQNDKNMVSQGKYYNPLPALYLFPRSDDFDEVRLFERWDPVLGYMTQYWPYGEGAHSLQNPYWIQKRMKRESDKRRYMLNASLKWEIADWINIVGRVRLDNSEYRITEKKFASTLTTFADMNGGYEDQTQHDRSFYGDVMVNIDKTFGTDWSITANIGASIDNQRFEQAGGAGNLKEVNLFTLNNLDYQNKYKPVQSGWH
ncbi:MAG: SusC/RagA family TonB-linked outer membrane protein, partial [Rikenellaceae bacterium]|nr:SusC/RagA family TonB-linked outer membrane protein [Rikenellaceae bacterium]